MRTPEQWLASKTHCVKSYVITDRFLAADIAAIQSDARQDREKPAVTKTNTESTYMKNSLIAVSLGAIALMATLSAMAEHPCTKGTVTPGQHMLVYLNGTQILTTTDYVDGSRLDFTDLNGCAPYTGITGAILQGWIFAPPDNWIPTGDSVPVILDAGCESSSVILHAHGNSICTDAYVFYAGIQEYCPCRQQYLIYAF